MSPGEQFISEIISSIGTLITLFLTGFADTFFAFFNSVIMDAFGLNG